jgi:hypothetical protein
MPQVEILEVSQEWAAAVEATNDLDSLIQAYIVLRDGKEEIKRLMTEFSSPLDSLMKIVNSKLMQVLDETNQESAKTASGTAYKKKSTSAKVADWNVLLEYIKKHDAYDLLTKGVAKDAVKSRIDETGEIVPGVDIVTFIDVGVRRA